MSVHHSEKFETQSRAKSLISFDVFIRVVRYLRLSHLATGLSSSRHRLRSDINESRYYSPLWFVVSQDALSRSEINMKPQQS